MKKLFFVVILFQLNVTVSLCQQNIYVSADGTNFGQQLPTLTNPFNNLENAYEFIQNNLVNANNEVVTDVNIYLMNGGGAILLSQSLNTLEWSISGTSVNQIVIQSYDCRSTLTRNSQVGHMFHFYETNYLTFKNIDFQKVTSGAMVIDESDFNEITFCSFSGDVGPIQPQSTGIIWIGVQNDYTGANCATSNNNIISNNLFYNMDVTSETHQHHAIYISRGASNNQIIGNTIKFAPSFGVAHQHSDYDNNIVSINFISRKERITNTNVTGIYLGYQWDTDFNNGGTSEIFENKIYNNYVYDSYNLDVVDITSGLPSSNQEYNNYRYNNYSPNDPYWLNYDAQKISDKMVSGDFDNDGVEDDIAAFYENGSQSNLHVWIGSIQGVSLIYSGAQGWWSNSSYSSLNIKGRVVSGNFDNDNFKDDIAVFYDLGGNSTQIQIFYSNGSSFSDPVTRWSSSGYNCTNVTGRVICGDFDRDGIENDIAAFYFYSSNETRIHVWKCNTNLTLTYSGSAGWWNTLGYNSQLIQGRVVAGDFDSDGFKDDIAAFYEYGLTETRIHVWRSSGTTFGYSGSTGWWGSTSFSSNRVISQLVSGDFDNDGYKDDIAGFYNINGEQTRLYSWKSTSSSFAQDYPLSAWNVSGYSADNLSKRIVSGDFDNDGYIDDIIGFYNYSRLCGNLRTHLWQSNISSFNYFNGSRGIPWLSGVYDYFGLDLSSNGPIEKDKDVEPFIMGHNIEKGSLIIKNRLINSKCSLIDLNGKIILSEFYEQPGDFEMDVNKISKGIYLLILEQGNEIKTEKIIIH